MVGGFTLKRRLEALGCQCMVIAPSLTPVKPGESPVILYDGVHKNLIGRQADSATQNFPCSLFP